MISRPGVSEWVETRIQARLLMAEYIVAMQEGKSTGVVQMWSAITPRKYQSKEWIRFLNGAYPLKLRSCVHIRYGAIVKRSLERDYAPSRELWDVTTHRKPQFAAWIDVMQKDPGLRELVFRAPDVRSLMVAMKVTGYRRAHNVPITREIQTYLWRWVHLTKDDET